MMRQLFTLVVALLLGVATLPAAIPADVATRLDAEQSQRVDQGTKEGEPPAVMPTFEGGDVQTFRYWLMRQLTYPDAAIEEGAQGRVLAHFVIDKKGRLVDATIESSPSVHLSQEVLRLLALSPKWEPARNAKGKRVAAGFHFPVEFRFE